MLRSIDAVVQMETHATNSDDVRGLSCTSLFSFFCCMFICVRNGRAHLPCYQIHKRSRYGEEGFEYPAEEVTHTFELSIVPEDEYLVQQRASLIAARRECARASGAWNVARDDYSNLPEGRVRLTAWVAAFDAAVAESEIALAELRHRTRVLCDVSAIACTPA